MPKTKIVVTIGPATSQADQLGSLIERGVDAFRINLSHGDHEEHRDTVARAMEIRERKGRPLSLIADTKGPEVRVEPSEGEEMEIERKGTVSILPKNSGTDGDEEGLFCDFSELSTYVREDQEILIGDGEITLSVESVTGEKVVCRALNGGRIAGRKRITLPGVSLPLPTITERDERDIRFAVEAGFEWIALSFVKEGNDIEMARRIVSRAEEDEDRTLLMAKIETREAVENIEEIIKEADGIMVARGDLGMSIELEEVPFIQKKIISAAKDAAKPVLTATQMLESMVDFPAPTRAEVTDVANAVLDGTDALMLSGETAIGKHPLKTVSTMYDIASRAEKTGDERIEELFRKGDGPALRQLGGVAPAIGRSACSVAQSLNAKAIICSTRSGYTARLIARFRPSVPIVAVTPSDKVRRQLALVWGVKAICIAEAEDTDELIESSVRSAKREGFASAGDLVVVTAGVPFHVRGTTNLIKVEEVKGS